MKGKQRVSFNFKLSGGFLFAPALALLGVIFVLSFVWVPASSAQDDPPFIWQVHELESDQTGLSNPLGLAFASKANAFQVLEGKAASVTSDLVELSPLADRKGVARIAA
ncbi:MAG TPA: hypothetical protein VJ785_01575, partial [Anaerolineales bacterium]|nr:hypothetical protein [Anaerolineales bacterium]